MICPLSMKYTLIHGDQAGTGEITVKGNFTVPMGTIATVTIGGGTWIGAVSEVNNNQDDTGGETTKFTLVDWRDRLHDDLIFAQFNMQNSDGTYHHLTPANWLAKRRTYVTKPLSLTDFDDLKDEDTDTLLNSVVDKRLLSGSELVNILAKGYGFFWSADPIAKRMLDWVRPVNMDWNGGTTVASALSQVLGYVGLRYWAYGTNRLHVTMKGMPNNIFVNAYLNGYADICTIGAESGNAGRKVNEKGRHITVIGDPNKRQWTYLCRPNWPDAWTWEICFSGWALVALLKSEGLTPLSKVKELPERFHDDEVWNEHGETTDPGDDPERTRSEMTIEEYLKKIPWRTYVVDAGTVVLKGLKDTVIEELDESEDETIQLDRDTLELEETAEVPGLGDVSTKTGVPEIPKNLELNLPFSSAYNFLWPPSSSLVTDTNMRYLIYATSGKIVRGSKHPFAVQHRITPMDGAANIEVQEKITKEGRKEWRVFLHFNSVQLFYDTDKPFDDPESYTPDVVFCELSLDTDTYVLTKGAAAKGFRKRRKTKTMNKLKRSYLNGEEVNVLATNLLLDLKEDGALVPGAKAVSPDSIASRVADIALFHETVSKSGGLNFNQRVGFRPDGLIDNVAVSYSDESGIKERIGFSGDLGSFTGGIIIFDATTTRDIKLEAEIAKDRLRDIADAVVSGDTSPIKAKHTVKSYDVGTPGPGGTPGKALSFARDGAVKVHIDGAATAIAKKGLNWGSVMILKEPKVAESEISIDEDEEGTA